MKKYKFIFIISKDSNGFGVIKKCDTLAEARELQKNYKMHGYKVTKIAKTTKA